MSSTRNVSEARREIGSASGSVVTQNCEANEKMRSLAPDCTPQKSAILTSQTFKLEKDNPLKAETVHSPESSSRPKKEILASKQENARLRASSSSTKISELEEKNTALEARIASLCDSSDEALPVTKVRVCIDAAQLFGCAKTSDQRRRNPECH